MKITNTYENLVIPSAKRLIGSLRDLGYDFSQAVADIIDNSIEAEATKIEIDIIFDGDNTKVRIVDNGNGMSMTELLEAMRFGSDSDYSMESLGKFGLGLKTASLSQCEILTVISRNNVETAFNALSWDLDHINKTDKWELIRPTNFEIERLLDNKLIEATGTVICWQHLDRMIELKHPFGEAGRKRFNKMTRDLEIHLAMVFHRFLAGEVPGRQISITLNGNKIEPWDPFARSEPKTLRMPKKKIPVYHNGISGVVIFEPYVLPPKENFSSVDEFRRASGPQNWNQQQGFYFYRQNRLIQSGGWSKIRVIDEHTKLARVAISFSPDLDEAFKINVAKMRVQLPDNIREFVEIALKPVISQALEVYKKSQKNTLPIPSSPAPAPNTTIPSSPALVKVNPPSVPPSPPVINQPLSLPATVKMWTLNDLQDQLEAEAEPEERIIVSNVFNRFRTKLNSKE